jgi:putative membrane protein
MDFRSFAAAFIFMTLACFGTPVPAHAETSSQTRDFVYKASEANMFEIRSSELALQKSTAMDVQTFAQKMVTNHTQIGGQFKQALAASDTGLSPAIRLNAEHQNTLDNLKSTSTSANFDKLYVQAQIKAHDDAVSLFTNYAQNGDNDDLQKFASNTLPILKEHLEMVHALGRSYLSSR